MHHLSSPSTRQHGQSCPPRGEALSCCHLADRLNIRGTPGTELIGPPLALTLSAKPVAAVPPLSVVPPKVITPMNRLSLPKQAVENPEPTAPVLMTGVAQGVWEANALTELAGVIGGIPSEVAPTYVPAPSPATSLPRAAIPKGGNIKEPKLVSVVNPVYPHALRRTGVSGDVVIDAVIDETGDVVQMRPVSGQRLLVLAAMDAVRRWK